MLLHIDDALFNLPAFLTADLWSKKGVESYLYRFDHISQNKNGFGHLFLRGLPIIGNNTAGRIYLLTINQFYFKYNFKITNYRIKRYCKPWRRLGFHFRSS